MATRKSSALPDWDADSRQLHANLARVEKSIAALALSRGPLSIGVAREWHRDMMRGLNPGKAIYVGAFRGEQGLEGVGVEIGGVMGAMPWDVEFELAAFERRLIGTLHALDAMYPNVQGLDENGLSAVLEVAAWAHSEWVRIHPFANGNGRTARMWDNLVLLRYGVPPVLRLRPRPDSGDYGNAGRAGMAGDNAPMAELLRRLFDAEVRRKQVEKQSEPMSRRKAK